MGRLREKIENRDFVFRPNGAHCRLKKECCTLCQNKGYVLTKSQGYVKALPCTCVQDCTTCYGTARTEDPRAPCVAHFYQKKMACLNQAGIPVRYKDADFACFNNQSGNLPKVLAKINHWIQNYSSQNNQGMIFFGGRGVGKTFILAAITRSLCEMGVTARFMDYHRLLLLLRAAYSMHKSDEEFFRPLLECDVLVIDELGRGRKTEWETEKIDLIVSGRYNLDRTIIASTPYELQSAKDDSLSERIGLDVYNKLSECCELIRLDGNDYRSTRDRMRRDLRV